ncbi:MAG: LysM peptidoglycan-binding domain-containing protein, partial [Gammaproteobacteria bacterium]
LPGELALLPVVESAYQPFAYSHGRAAGIWQFIPGTARHYGLKQNWWYDGRRDIVESTRAALDYLQYLHKTFDGDWLLALAAYNSGSGTVRNAIRKNRRHGKATDFWSLHLPRETQAYVPKLLAISEIVATPEKFQLSLAPIPDEPFLVPIATGSQIDLALAAELADLSLDEIYRFNPGFNRWATDPDGPHRLLLPAAVAESFSSKLSEVPTGKRIKWVRHLIREGETLGHIAKRYGTTVTVLKQVNGIGSHLIRSGKSMIIPVATRDLKAYRLSEAQRLRTIQNQPKKGIRIVHTVRPGDTLWDLSRKYHVGTRQLAKWNGMAPRDYLRPGQKLVIWQSSRKHGARARTVSMTPGLNGITRRIHYTVRKGDSLARISQRFKVTVSELRTWNALPKGKYLQPGQKLTLYVDVTRQTGS